MTTSSEARRNGQGALHPAGHIAPGRRASLVDAIMDLPEVQASARMEAAVPRGDGESLERLRERTEDAVARQAGSTTLLDANIPSGSEPNPVQTPAANHVVTRAARGRRRRAGGHGQAQAYGVG